MDDDVAARVATMLGWDGPIRPGEIVYLKSGSVGMTAQTVRNDVIECVWFDKATVRTHNFPEVVLTKQPISADGKTRGVVIIGDLPLETDTH